MSVGQTNDKGAWAWFGKIAAVLAVIWLVIQIFNYFSTKDVKIVAEGEYSPFSLPDNIFDQMSRMEPQLDDIAQIEKLLPEKLENRSALASNIYNSIFKERFSNLLKISSVNSIWSFNITNEGSKEAVDLKLIFPSVGYYRLYKSGGEHFEAVRFNDIIPIGNLRPSESVELSVWANNFPALDPETRDIRITYPDGVAYISYPAKIKGWLANIFNISIEHILYFVQALLLFSLFALIGFKVYRKVKGNSKKERVEPVADKLDNLDDKTSV